MGCGIYAAPLRINELSHLRRDKQRRRQVLPKLRQSVRRVYRTSTCSPNRERATSRSIRYSSATPINCEPIAEQLIDLS